ncbi:AP180 N-terminal homology (ANTH) domain [Macleaya cordata]|uniref:AP180 N-terminal homology (ANTH) domain n=1 Tax=Macleaya cordata TaxID=56857 RepID=A0A200QG88_MACCD|nr:AP180 N-terminal homology (ANTH) domain [Macleaya cordata]
MAGGSSTQQSFRKALGALKDSTKVGLAKVNSDYKELDVAIVKATNHVERVAKEKHVRFIFEAVSASRPRADVSYCIHALSRRLAKTHNWAVALKTLFVMHRALREVDPTFREELINYRKSRGYMLNLSHFKDDSSPHAWDYSAWVRTYALYLEERLECIRILKYDVEADRPVTEESNGTNLFLSCCEQRTRELGTDDLLEQLPALQQLLFRLLACLPEGAATYNIVIQNALSLVASESVRIYAAISDGILNLVDKFFEMQRHDAVRALEIYKKAGNQTERLSEFYEKCRGLELGRGQKFVKLEQPPASFLTAMEEYVKEAPRTLMLQRNVANGDRGATPKAGSAPREVLSVEQKKEPEVEENPETNESQPEAPRTEASEAPVVPPITDLLGLDELSQDPSELDEKNSLALAIYTSDDPSTTANNLSLTVENTGWELALVTAPSSNETAVAGSKLAGGFDKLTLDSLYDNAMVRSANPNGAYQSVQGVPNPFGTAPQFTEDPFYASNGIAPPTNVQMAAMNQQHQALMQQQQQQQIMISQDTTNPFGNPFLGQGVPSNPPQNPYTGFI